MAMSRKDFEAIARAIRCLELDYRTRVEIAEAIADQLTFINARFDRARFILAATENNRR